MGDGEDNTPCNYLKIHDFNIVIGGGGGIRTHGRLSPTSVFKTGAFDHSATPPTATLLAPHF